MKKFTIHFATINTEVEKEYIVKKVEFTIHFATINTNALYIFSLIPLPFTIHFATINTENESFSLEEIPNLQYTLLLLIPF